ncbi:MAG TPA: bifunctional (p)ppGpp synthetase/guanosine-3',5'-bis(diphosphate) 3'-pyrophosphohydrolase [Candidatus Angelobacter sp.]|nr:bifunctional (p)ppGpp synthetase/guanosine-3',5'-bis(diphosphate) 3'-pyrophosphohydrolase [Candidatus Angelobacter sp.]
MATNPRPDAAHRMLGAKFDQLLSKVAANRPHDDREIIRKAYEFSLKHHEGQTRASGEPFLIHPLEVSLVLADMKLDSTAIAAGLLHDAIEDTPVTDSDVGREFGDHVLQIVQGVTKIDKIDFASREERQAENVRKMVLAMVNDIRVVLIKLADRLHNMRTLKHLPEDRRQAVARETLEIYAPLAHRLGMGKVRGELEDLSFRYVDPIGYEQVRTAVESRRKAGEKFLAGIVKILQQKLKENGVEARLESRIKRLYSIHQKLIRQRITVDQVYDLLAVRIITKSVKDCYTVLGSIHQMWRPVPGRIKDFIAMPRPNLYQSLHTTVITEDGHQFELQIRTEEMHKMAEEGIAAHWKYKDGSPVSAEDEQRLNWLRQVMEWQQDVKDPSEFLSTFKVDLYPEEVYTFTPKGKVVILPRDASTIDFAYAIHTEVGHTCVGAKVNGRIVPFRYKLHNGDVVEIMTQTGHNPSRDWLSFTKSSRARNKIKHWLNIHQRERAIEIGKKLLERQARKYRLAIKDFDEKELTNIAQDYGVNSGQDLMAGIGYGKFSARQILAKLSPGISDQPPVEEPPKQTSTLGTVIRRVFGQSGETGAIKVKGYNDLLVYRARCCNPIRGEAIVGYVTRGKGVAVHAVSCPNVTNLMYEADRRIAVEWAKPATIGKSDSKATYPVKLTVFCDDRAGMLKQLTAVISDDNTNIRNIEARTADSQATIDVVIDIQDVKHLERIMAGLRKIPGIRDVQRLNKV